MTCGRRTFDFFLLRFIACLRIYAFTLLNFLGFPVFFTAVTVAFRQWKYAAQQHREAAPDSAAVGADIPCLQLS